jgi:hypothetical protein
MVLSTGEEIALKKDNSTIALNDATNQVTVNDSIIDLTQNKCREANSTNERGSNSLRKKIGTAACRRHQSVAQCR